MSETAERLPDCPLLSCTPQGRSEHVCYGRNGVRRACMYVGGAPLLMWEGDGAWSGPADWLKQKADALKEEVKT